MISEKRMSQKCGLSYGVVEKRQLDKSWKNRWKKGGEEGCLALCCIFTVYLWRCRADDWPKYSEEPVSAHSWPQIVPISY